MADKPDDRMYTRRIIDAHELYSAHLRENRIIRVCLPWGVAADDVRRNHEAPAKRWPVLYFHDGDEFFSHGRIATIANRLTAQSEIHPLLLVGIAVRRDKRSEDYHPGGARHEAYLRFVVEECLPWVERHYAINRGQRAMAGVSLGAAAALSLAIRNPGLVLRLLLFSGAFYTGQQEQVAATALDRSLAAYMTVGSGETQVDIGTSQRNFVEYSRQMRDLLQAKGASVVYHETVGTHLWGFWQSQIADALRWLEAGTIPLQRA